MDEQKTDDLEEFFDLNQEQAEEDEKNESRNEDVDRGDDVISFSSEESVFFSCDETDEDRTAAECVAENEAAKQMIKGVLKSNGVTNTVVEDNDANAEANEATPKCVEETRESNILYTLEVPFNQPRESCWTIVKKNILDCMCCCCTPSSCVACNTRIREQAASQFVSVPQCCTTHTPGGKVKIAIAPGKTDITPYMASLGIISLEAYMELEAQKKARENVNTTQETKRAEREAEFMQIIENITPKRVEVVEDKNENAEANGAAPKRVGRMKRLRKFLQRVFCCSG
ncbi:uncharacterized protein [Magallana gigas]|uniref:uncharacterized protein isoform X1 n=1 Tax=Magallana gigas TaxID=29159 RepID=UPI00333EBD4E